MKLPEHGLLNRLKSATTEFSRAERQVAEYLLKYPHESVSMPIKELADVCRVSEPTIVRFSSSMGFKGFRAFKLAFAKSLATGIPYLHLDVNQADSAKGVLSKVFDRAIAALVETRNAINQNDSRAFETAVQILSSTKRIECFGLGYSGALAVDAQLKFFRLGIATTAVCDAHLQAQCASLLNKDSVVLAFSRTGRTKDMIRNVQIAKRSGAKVIVFSASNAPLAEYADAHLTIDVEEDPDVYAPMNSRLAHLTYIDALSVAVTLARGPSAISMLEKAKSSIGELRIGIDLNTDTDLKVG